MALFPDEGSSVGLRSSAPPAPFAGLGAPVSTYEQLQALWSWRAESRPVWAGEAGAAKLVEGWQALCRSDDSSVLAIQKDSYQPIQYGDGLGLLEAAVGEGEVVLETAGTFGHGVKAWALARVTGVDLEVAGGPVMPYVLFASSHDSSLPLSVLCTPVYVCCQNTLMAALAGARDRFSIRHSGDVDAKVSEARRVISGCRAYFGTFGEAAIKLASAKMEAWEFRELTEALFPEPKREGGPTGNSRASQARARLMDLYRGEQIAAAFGPGTRWAAFNAVTQYLDRDRSGRGDADTRAQSSVWGSASLIRQKAFDLLAAAEVLGD